MNDVSADADPNTGAAVYDTARGGWMQVGGTSLAAPLIAGVYGLAANATTVGYPASLPYANAASLRDVTSGNDLPGMGGFFLRVDAAVHGRTRLRPADRPRHSERRVGLLTPRVTVPGTATAGEKGADVVTAEPTPLRGPGRVRAAEPPAAANQPAPGSRAGLGAWHRTGRRARNARPL